MFFWSYLAAIGVIAYVVAVPALMLAATTVAPGFWDWSFDPPLVLVIDLAILYWLGDRRTVTPARARRERRLQRACFYGALAVLAIALSSPLEILSEQLFWAHMVQHVLLLVVAPPLLVLADPWIRLWRSLPLQSRRGLARALGKSPRTGWLRALSRALGSPQAAFVAFSTTLLVWHVPALFDATLRSSALHALEHSLFFASAADVLEAGDRLAAAARSAVLGGAHRLPDRRDGRQLAAGDRAGTRATPAVLVLRARGEPPRRHLGAG